MAEENTTTPDSGTTNEMITALQSKLSKQSDIVSSASTGVENAIGKAVASTKAGTAAETARIESQFGRAIGDVSQQGADQVQNFSESRSGFATQMTGLRKLVETTDKNLNDLEQRKQELILQNNSAGAAKISELQLKSLEFKLNSEQQVFSNLLSQSSFGLQAAQFGETQKQNTRTFELAGKQYQLSADAQSFAEKQAVGSVALEFGLQVSPNDTIDSIITRAQQTGIVDEKRALELEQMRSSINASNATAANALNNIKTSKSFDAATSQVLANSILSGERNVEDVTKGMTPTQQGQVLMSMEAAKISNEKQLIEMAQSSGGSASEFRQKAEASNVPYTQDQVDRIAASIVAEKAGGSTGIPSLAKLYMGLGETLRTTGIGAGELITGRDISGGGFGN